MPPEIRAVGIEGLPEVRAGDDLATQIMDAAAAQGTPIEARRRGGGHPEDRQQSRGPGDGHRRGRGFPVGRRHHRGPPPRSRATPR